MDIEGGSGMKRKDEGKIKKHGKISWKRNDQGD